MRLRVAALALLIVVIGLAVLTGSPSGFTGSPWWSVLPLLLAVGFAVYLVRQSRRG